MINVNDNTILNPDNVVIAEQKGSMYKLTLINGKILYVNADVYEDVIAYESVSKEYVDSKLSGALKRLIVQALPTEDIDTNTIYMVLDPESVSPNNIYNEYMYISSTWELIGTTATSSATPNLYLHNVEWVGASNSGGKTKIHLSVLLPYDTAISTNNAWLDLLSKLDPSDTAHGIEATGVQRDDNGDTFRILSVTSTGYVICPTAVGDEVLKTPRFSKSVTVTDNVSLNIYGLTPYSS